MYVYGVCRIRFVNARSEITCWSPKTLHKWYTPYWSSEREDGNFILKNWGVGTFWPKLEIDFSSFCYWSSFPGIWVLLLPVQKVLNEKCCLSKALSFWIYRHLLPCIKFLTPRSVIKKYYLAISSRKLISVLLFKNWYVNEEMYLKI